MRSRSWLLIYGMIAATGLLIAPATQATQVPPLDAVVAGQPPDDILHSEITEGFVPLVQRLMQNRQNLAAGSLSPADAERNGGLAIRGQKNIPVLMLRF